MACCCTFTNTVDQQFTNKKAGQELERYRRKGAGPTTRLLLAGIEQAASVTARFWTSGPASVP